MNLTFDFWFLNNWPTGRPTNQAREVLQITFNGLEVRHSVTKKYTDSSINLESFQVCNTHTHTHTHRHSHARTHTHTQTNAQKHIHVHAQTYIFKQWSVFTNLRCLLIVCPWPSPSLLHTFIVSTISRPFLSQIHLSLSLSFPSLFTFVLSLLPCLHCAGGQPAPWSYRCCGTLSNTRTLPAARNSAAHAKKCKI